VEPSTEYSTMTDEQSEFKMPRVLYEVSSVAHDEEIQKQSVCQINEERYSSLRRFLRITCFCLKFIKRKVWNALSTSHREMISRKYVLLGKVFNSLSDTQLVNSVDIKLAMLLWVYSIRTTVQVSGCIGGY